MDDKMIRCPHCTGGMIVNDIGYGLRCDYCKGVGTIPDRRKDITIPTANWLRLVWLMAHTPELTAEQNAEVERIIASVNGGES